MEIINSTKNRNLDELKLLIKNGINIDTQDNFGNTSLIYASENDDIEIVKFLVKNNVDVNIQNKEGNNALLMASYYNNIDIVKYLLENGAVISIKNNDNLDSLLIASKNNYFDLIKLLINYGANINTIDDKGNTLLILKTIDNNLDIVKFLIQNKININVKNFNGYTSLMIASSRNNIEIVKLLIENGADINLQDNEGFTALSLASYKDNIEIVKLLVKNKADVTLKNTIGKTAFDLSSNPIIRSILKPKPFINPIPKCSSTDDLFTTDDLNDFDTIAIFLPNLNKAECISFDSWKTYITDQANLEKCIYKVDNLLNTKIPLRYAPIFKLPTNNIPIQSNYHLLLRYNTFILEPIGVQSYGNRYGGNLEKTEVFIAIPINRRIAMSQSTVEIPVNKMYFIPEEEDKGIEDPKYPYKENTIVQITRGESFLETNRETGETYYCFTSNPNRVLM
jgi:ankyrin repeat protein